MNEGFERQSATPPELYPVIDFLREESRAAQIATEPMPTISEADEIELEDIAGPSDEDTERELRVDAAREGTMHLQRMRGLVADFNKGEYQSTVEYLEHLVKTSAEATALGKKIGMLSKNYTKKDARAEKALEALKKFLSGEA